MSDMPVVSVQALCKDFGTNSGGVLEVLRDVSFDVWQNEIVALIGSSGCGKTTLLRMICGFENIDSGKVLIDGAPWIRPGKDVLMLFQDFKQLMPWRTVLNNVEYPLLATKAVKTKKEAASRALRRLEDVGLSKFGDSYPHQLSGGMQQRAAVARALALLPRVLLMDEPFASLDNITRSTLQTLTRNVCEKYGLTTIIVTHSVEEAAVMADRIIVMEKNPGRTKTILKNPDKSDPEQRSIFVEEILKLLGEP